MPRVVLDTNVIVSAVISDKGPPRHVFEAWAAGRFTLLMCPSLIAEVARALRYDRIQRRYRLADEDIRATLALLWSQGEVSPDPSHVESVTGEAGDDTLLALCRDADAEFLVTGDRQLLGLGSHGPARIVSPAEFAKVLGSAPAQ